MKGGNVLPGVFGRLCVSQDSAPGSSGLSLKDYRLQVIRDIRWLLNTRCQPSFSSVHLYKHVATSTLNYGLRDMVGVIESQVDPEEIAQAVRSAILRYEPRIIPASLSVDFTGLNSEETIDEYALEIHGDLWAWPNNEPMSLRTRWCGSATQWVLA